jgi:hypothetical protein
MVWLELLVLGILWVLWVATAAEVGQANALVGFSNCDALLREYRLPMSCNHTEFVLAEFVPICREFAAVEGLSIVVCILSECFPCRHDALC